MSASPWVVHKFGGTSVASAERYRTVARVALAEPGPRRAIVVSAMSKVTDGLLDLVELARKRDDSYLARAAELERRHLATLAELVPAGADSAVADAVARDFRDLREVLRGVYLTRVAGERTQDLVAGHGELWSAQLLDAHLRASGNDCTWLDARDVLVVEPEAAGVTVDWPASQGKFDTWLGAHPAQTLVITGYVAATHEGIPCTLKRNGSDLSASIFGRLLAASSITIWTDVDGVLSADPRLVPEAIVVDELSYDEATELAYFGAKVVHPATMAPAIDARIPIRIRNTFNPTHPGTLIDGRSTSSLVVKGFTAVENMALVNIEGTGMVGVPGVAERLFGALRDVGVSVVLISQASSEHSICFAIPEAQAPLARATVEKAFFAELHHGQLAAVQVALQCSILAAVGDNMVKQPGVAARLFTALGNAGVNVRAIAQGSSERNISVVIDGRDSRRALRAVHAAFYLSEQTISLGVIGPGLIGSTLLTQLHQEMTRLHREQRIDFRVRGICDTKRMILDEQSIDLATWRERLAEHGVPTDLDAFAAHVHADHLPHAAILDCTASAAIPERIVGWLERGLHVVTPNKKGNTGSYASYRKIHDTARSRRRHYLYSTTVGAGLPVLNTLRELVRTGDQVLQIEGILSGTLSYIFNNLVEGRAFSDVVGEARARGYTEPDPRDDIAGTDVARKLVILAREMGLPLELDAITVESLVPPSLRGGTVDEFLAGLPSHDGTMSQRADQARARGEVLRYVGVIAPDGHATVELRGYPTTHAFARLSGSDNIVAFTTARYASQPLIVQGPGAGPEVTAGGVFADLLRLAAYVGGAR